MVLEHLNELVKIFHLKSKVYLFSQCSLERLLINWKIHSWRKERGQVAHEEHEINVTFNVNIYVGMPYFYGYFLAFVHSLIDLTH